MTKQPTDEMLTRPTRQVAIVGAGPAGFFTAASLLANKNWDVHVDLLERLPTPTGLVRAGVAPDHPRIKSVAATFDKTANHERFRFFGNLEVGRHVTCDELAERYDAVIYTHGAQADRSLGIPGEDLDGVISASDFVGWYNGHPDHSHQHVDLATERAVVIGNGNVALDVARILATDPQSLRTTDMADHAIDALEDSKVREVVIVGRRGPAQASFTTAELIELSTYTEAVVRIDAEEIDEDDETHTPVVKRNLEELRRYAQEPQEVKPRTITLRFRATPVEIRGAERAEELVVARNDLVVGEDGTVRAVDNGERETIRAGLVVRAVGYRGRALPGLPFDEATGLVPSTEGRIQGRPRQYVAGWIKRGPSGIIGTNKKCAVETCASVVEDFGLYTAPGSEPRAEATADWLRSRQPELVTWDAWSRIDAAERAAGEQHGRPRTKLCSTQLLIDAAEIVERATVGPR